MPFAHIDWNSATLQKAVGMNVLLPTQGKPPWPVFYLLHGLSDDHTMWQRRSRIEMYAAEYPLIVVMPDGFRGFYTNNEEGPAYATYMAEELPSFVERHFQAIPERHGRCIGGLSMGGYGALRLALGYPDRYASANSHSGALLHHLRSAESPEFARIWGDKAEGSDHDLQALARRAASQGKLPALKIDCGTEDFLLEDNRRFHGFLREEGIAHDYAEYPGNHNWDYWDLHVREALAFHAIQLKLAPSA